MKRKIVLQGGAALTMTIPTQWAKKNNVKKGDEIEMIENKNALVVFPSGNNLDNYNEFSTILDYDCNLIKTQLVALYEKGYDEVHVAFKNEADLREIEKIVNRLIGFVIVDEHVNKCTIKCLSQPKDEEFNNILSRNFLVTLQIVESVLGNIKNPNKDFIYQIYSLKETSTRLTIFCRRFILKNSNKYESVYLYSLVRDLERVSDQFLAIHDLILNNKLYISSKSLKILEDSRSFFKYFYKFYYSKNLKYNALFYNLKSELDEKISQLPKSDIIIKNNLDFMVRLIYDLFISINTKMS
jgi:phosphate uptake regulator